MNKHLVSIINARFMNKYHGVIHVCAVFFFFLGVLAGGEAYVWATLFGNCMVERPVTFVSY